MTGMHRMGEIGLEAAGVELVNNLEACRARKRGEVRVTITEGKKLGSSRTHFCC